MHKRHTHTHTHTHTASIVVMPLAICVQQSLVKLVIKPQALYSHTPHTHAQKTHINTHTHTHTHTCIHTHTHTHMYTLRHTHYSGTSGSRPGCAAEARMRVTRVPFVAAATLAAGSCAPEAPVPCGYVSQVVVHVGRRPSTTAPASTIRRAGPSSTKCGPRTSPSPGPVWVWAA